MSNDSISVSVIIPTLCEEKRIGVLLRALCEQNYDGGLQIVVCDGDSDDATRDIVAQFPKVLCVTSPRGVSRQRNAGARHATGELLIWMDADDAPTKYFVCDVVRSYRRLRFAAACPWFTARENAIVALAYFGFNVLFWLGQSTLRMGSGVCIIARREVFERLGGFDESLHLGEDIHFLRRAGRIGLHRHLLIPLETSGRRFQQKGALKLMWFYTRITPALLLGLWHKLREVKYEAASYQENLPENSSRPTELFDPAVSSKPVD